MWYVAFLLLYSYVVLYGLREEPSVVWPERLLFAWQATFLLEEIRYVRVSFCLVATFVRFRYLSLLARFSTVTSPIDDLGARSLQEVIFLAELTAHGAIQIHSYPGESWMEKAVDWWSFGSFATWNRVDLLVYAVSIAAFVLRFLPHCYPVAR